eukprot:CAMPEP_0170503536 /NCGR_PEP_ID=MMETSP0208-20121228/45119_1 /TAXON_ID=197538 /ORGANISM="Strombidium inclinatum, Strain S3" /LENGTH=79 /DNA_ID=CAMNT_0010783251 /DNA_START=147 /DNA_END=386 /DNA_ORIENTATION=+
MDAQTFIEPHSRSGIGVAARTPSFVAVLELERRAVVAGGHNPTVPDDDRPNGSFHTVGPRGSDVGNSHEVRVPLRPEQL